MNFICSGAGKTDRPENTLLAIENCVSTNKNWTIHLDIQQSRDNQIIVFKDNNTKRICQQDLAINTLSLEEIQKLDAAYHFKQENQFPFRNKNITIPSLKEVFEQFPNTKFILDIHTKNMTAVDEIIKLIESFKMTDKVILTSQVNEIILNLKEKRPMWNFAATTVRARKIVYSNMFYLDSIIPEDANLMIIPKCDKDSLFLRERIIAYCNQQDKQTWTWIFEGERHNSKSILSQISELEKQGLKGIFTNSPSKIQNALNQNRSKKIAS